jgi:hypothetical protein
VRWVTMMRYTMPPMRAHPITTKMARLTLHCLRFWVVLSDSTVAECSVL